METLIRSAEASRSPLEGFLRDYVETIGGDWDEVEPQVYDLLLPSQQDASPLDVAGRGMMRVAFDPEAIPEHPGAQLARFGTPLLGGLFQDPLPRCPFAH